MFYYKKSQNKISLIAYLIGNGISIPHYCYHNDLSVSGNCWVYLIEHKNSIKSWVSCAIIVWAYHAILAQAKKHALIAFFLTLVLAIVFTCLQGLEYFNSLFNISDGVYGSSFYLATGFHGLHVIIGILALFVSFLWSVFNYFGFEFVIGYSIFKFFLSFTFFILLLALYLISSIKQLEKHCFLIFLKKLNVKNKNDKN